MKCIEQCQHCKDTYFDSIAAKVCPNCGICPHCNRPDPDRKEPPFTISELTLTLNSEP